MSITIHFKADEDVVKDFDEVFASAPTKYRTRSDFLRSMMEEFIRDNRQEEPRVVEKGPEPVSSTVGFVPSKTINTPEQTEQRLAMLRRKQAEGKSGR